MKQDAKRSALFKQKKAKQAQGPGIWLSRGELVEHFELAISDGSVMEGAAAFAKYKTGGVTVVSTEEFVEALGRGFGVGRI
tara:strand:- start:1229 stop:1471 length:243 start_codon:yes stop_codon:yes gene_type:complete